MGEALVGGLLEAGAQRVDELTIVEPIPARRAVLETIFPGVDVTDTPVRGGRHGDRGEAGRCAGRLPSCGCRGLRARALDRGRGHVGDPRGAPGRRHAGGTCDAEHPALVGLGASAIAPGSHAADADLAWAESLLAAVGIVVRVKEPLLDAVTGLSGSGPAYVFLVAEGLIEAGVLAGLPREVSEALSVQTLLGAATLLATSDDGAEALRAAVTSPGGTTAAGLRVLEQHGLRSALLEAVAAATDRSRELGGQPGQQPQRPL